MSWFHLKYLLLGNQLELDAKKGACPLLFHINYAEGPLRLRSVKLLEHFIRAAVGLRRVASSVLCQQKKWGAGSLF
jgi:hypothetical protein